MHDGMRSNVLKYPINQAFKKTLFALYFEAGYQPNYATQKIAQNSEPVLGKRIYTARADMIVKSDIKQLYFRHIIIKEDDVYFCFTEIVGAGNDKMIEIKQSVLYRLLDEKRLFCDYEVARKRVLDVTNKTKSAYPSKMIWYSEGEKYYESAEVVK